MRNTFAEHFLQLAKADNRLILITGDLGYGVLDKIATEIPDQFINAGIAEQSMMSMAAGLASQGYRPFVYSIANFPTFRCLEQIRNDVCYMNNPVTIVSVGAGLSYGNLGYTHHAVEDISIMRSLLNIDLYSPGEPIEVQLCISDILELDRPAYLRLGKGGERALSSEQVGKTCENRQIRTGRDGYIAFTGGIGALAIEAHELLAELDICPSVISVPKLTRENIQKLNLQIANSHVLILEEHVLGGGFGSWVLEERENMRLQFLTERMGVDQSNKSILGSQRYLLEQSGLTADSIAAKFRSLLDLSRAKF